MVVFAKGSEPEVPGVTYANRGVIGSRTLVDVRNHEVLTGWVGLVVVTRRVALSAHSTFCRLPDLMWCGIVILGPESRVRNLWIVWFRLVGESEVLLGWNK